MHNQPGSDKGAEDESTTKLAGGQPAPGHDIFAGKIEQDQARASRSNEPPPRQVEEKVEKGEEKEISLVVTATTADSPPATPEPVVEQVGPAPKESAEDAESTPTPEAVVGDGKVVPAGPKGEAELEALKVAAELYPSAVSDLD